MAPKSPRRAIIVPPGVAVFTHHHPVWPPFPGASAPTTGPLLAATCRTLRPTTLESLCDCGMFTLQWRDPPSHAYEPDQDAEIATWYGKEKSL
jgi:hypothetical protein